MSFNVKRRSFYISLFVCVMAIGAAGWSTYKSIKDFSSSGKRESSQIMPKKKIRNAENIPKKGSLASKNENSNTQNVPSEVENPENLQEVSAKVSPPDFIIPMDYSNVSNFNDDLEFSPKFQDWRTSDGVDLKGKNQSNIIAAANGKVMEIFDDPSYGSTIKLKCSSSDGKETIVYYSELDPKSILVKKNEEISQGKEIAKLQFDNLHLMVQSNGKFVDPRPFFGI